LGQTKETTNPETAINLLLEREFPQLLECQKDPHEAFFIPDSFIYGGIAAKVILIIYLYKRRGASEGYVRLG
jgi:hypothetical protein